MHWRKIEECYILLYFRVKIVKYIGNGLRTENMMILYCYLYNKP